MEPDRLPLVTVEPRHWLDPIRKGFDLTATKAPLFRAPCTGQEPLVAQVHDMLPRRPQDGRGLACSNEVALVHVGTMPQKHKKRNHWKQWDQLADIRAPIAGSCDSCGRNDVVRVEKDPGMDWTKMLMADLRSTGGISGGPLAGKPHLIMTSTGARTGEPREAILSFVRDGENYVVAGTKSGAPTDPAWVRNVTANPVVKVEAELRTFQANARVVTDEATYQRLWNAHVESRPDFAGYPAKAGGRKIPVIILEPIASE
jgi:deazaflavin-dependent oxidoreductase (nitroreductase family)